jgi:hypothetical protein
MQELRFDYKKKKTAKAMTRVEAMVLDDDHYDHLRSILVKTRYSVAFAQLKSRLAQQRLRAIRDKSQTRRRPKQELELHRQVGKKKRALRLALLKCSLTQPMRL